MKHKLIILITCTFLCITFLNNTPRSFSQSTVITLDAGTHYQTFKGWEATVYAANWPGHSPAYPKYLNELLDQTVNDLGITRVRLEVGSGAENPVDYGLQFLNGQINETEYVHAPGYVYQIINDNNDPQVINPNGFHFSFLDHAIDDIVIPMKQHREAKGEKLYINLNYVDFGNSPFEHKNDPEEYAEFILAVFEHINNKYGWVPDGVEIALEPHHANWNAKQVGEALVAVANRLQAHNYTPDFIAPSHAFLGLDFFDSMVQQVPTVTQHITEFSYHCYANCGSDTNLLGVGSRGVQYGIDTSQLEHIGRTYKGLVRDLKLANVSAWAQYDIAGVNQDGGGDYYIIDDSDPNNPIINIGTRTKFLRQYIKFIRPGAVRIEAASNNSNFDPVAFINANGGYVVVVQTTSAGSFSVQNLPAGTYGIKYTTDVNCGGIAASDYDIDLSDITLTAGQTLNTNIPRCGVITVYAKVPSSPSVPPSNVNIVGPTTGATQISYAFTANVTPMTTTQPITYTWEATEQSPVTSHSGASHTVNYTWNTIGTKTITVTADNTVGSAVTAHLIDITAPIPPSNVGITGPAMGFVQNSYPFTATIAPATATPPFTYTWEATEQSPVTVNGGLADTTSFAWSSPGTKAITVTAVNAVGSAVGTYSTEIKIGPISSVSITGPTGGVTNLPYLFVASTAPPTNTVTLPITYVWQAINQNSPVIHSNNLSDTVTFTWNTTGTKTITVTATNAGGSVFNTHQITIDAAQQIYLPIIFRQ